MSTRHTHATNTTAHPGAILLAVQGKRHTKAEKAVDDNHAALEKAAAEKATQERVIAITKLVMQLHKEQNAMATAPVSNLLILPSLIMN
ncbi:hypothetical protein JVU11DRAFT_10765 [Chiua virens]|nr:hypothetical protein JVU11DRAFT_10760 [Chiua virens]KAG9309281.1 hypothetical protein JVU11DRAFT_10765 [Chiua virens]